MSNGNGHRWSKFWWCDWRRDMGLRMCSLAARGLWMEMLCLAHDAEPCGHVTIHGRNLTTKDLAILSGATEREVKKLLAELEAEGVFSRTEDGVIYCRRMVREAAADAEAAAAWRAHGKNGGNPQIIRGTVAKTERQRPYRRSDSPQKTERIFQRAGGKCHWCGVILIRTNPTHPHYFHVDHVVAVRDGGSNDEDNLVAACQGCNIKRARHDDTAPSDSNPTPIPTVIRQQPSAASDSNQKLDIDSESERETQKESKFLSSLSKVEYEAPPAREDPPTPAEIAAERRRHHEALAAVPPSVAAVLNSLAESMSGVAYAPGWSPKRTAEEQAAAVEQKRPKTYHLTPEQLRVARGAAMASRSAVA